MEAIITVGIPRSGKSTYAKALRGSHIEINRDIARSALTGLSKLAYYSQKKSKIKELENIVTQYCNNQIRLASMQGRDIIISDTNLNEQFRDDLVCNLKTFGYDVFIREFPISFEDAMERNETSGDDYVKESVMYSFWKRWLDYKGNPQKITQDSTLPSVYLVDIDGTVADHKGIRSPFDWSSVMLDKPRHEVINVIEHLEKLGNKIIFMSGRDSFCRTHTVKWLRNHTKFTDIKLYMREQNDSRKDSIIKRELFDKHIAGKYYVRGVFDDRHQVVRMWRDMGLTVFNVGDIDDEF